MSEEYEINILTNEGEEEFLKNNAVTVFSLGVMELEGNPTGGELFRISRVLPGRGEIIEYFKIVHIDEVSIPKKIILKKTGEGSLN